MKLLSFRTTAVIATVTGGALAIIAACASGPTLPAVPNYGPDTGTGGSGSSSGSGQSSSSSGSSSGVSGASDGGSGDMDATLITYDGPPPNVDGGLLTCATPDGLPIKYNPMYSGFDGTHSYQIPSFVVGVDPSTVTWGSSDPSMVAFQPYVRGIMITTKKAGDVTIVAKIGAKCGSAPLHITQFTVDDWNIGGARYNNGNSLVFSLPDGRVINIDAAAFDARAFEGGLPDVDLPDSFVNPFENPPAACTNCHGDVGNGMVFKDISHTPEQTGGFSEAELTNCFLHGTIPDGGYFDPTILPYKYWHQLHTWWDIDTPAKQVGMNAYLRALTPQQQLGCFELFNTNPCDAGLD
jgi:hypothetical protein